GRKLSISCSARARFMSLTAVRASSGFSASASSTPPSMCQPEWGVQTKSAAAKWVTKSARESAAARIRRRGSNDGKFMAGNMKEFCREGRSKISMPPEKAGAPGETGSERDHENDVATFNPFRAPGFVEDERNGGGGGVADAIDVERETVERQLEAVGQHFNNADVGLVRNDESDFGRIDIVLGEDVDRRFFHDSDGDLEDLFAVH